MSFEEDSQQVEVRLEGETAWLTQKQAVELLGQTLTRQALVWAVANGLQEQTI